MHTESYFLKVLINASRIYWREEFENRHSPVVEENERHAKDYHFAIDAPRLTEQEKMKPLRHLANKCKSPMDNGKPAYRRRQICRTCTVGTDFLILPKEATEKLKKVLVAYYAKEIDMEMDALWKVGKMTAVKNEKIAHTHLRTPYK